MGSQNGFNPPPALPVTSMSQLWYHPQEQWTQMEKMWVYGGKDDLDTEYAWPFFNHLYYLDTKARAWHLVRPHTDNAPGRDGASMVIVDGNPWIFGWTTTTTTTTNHKPQATSHQPQATSHKPPTTTTTNQQQPINNNQQPTIHNQQPADNSQEREQASKKQATRLCCASFGSLTMFRLSTFSTLPAPKSMNPSWPLQPFWLPTQPFPKHLTLKGYWWTWSCKPSRFNVWVDGCKWMWCHSSFLLTPRGCVEQGWLPCVPLRGGWAVLIGDRSGKIWMKTQYSNANIEYIQSISRIILYD